MQLYVKFKVAIVWMEVTQSRMQNNLSQDKT